MVTYFYSIKECLLSLVKLVMPNKSFPKKLKKRLNEKCSYRNHHYKQSSVVH